VYIPPHIVFSTYEQVFRTYPVRKSGDTSITNRNVPMFSKCSAETSCGGAAVHEKPDEKGLN